MPPSREEPRGLVEALLSGRYATLGDVPARPGPADAPPIVPASALTERPARDVVAELDASAAAPEPARWRPVRYQLTCAVADLDDVLAFTAPAPLAVYVTDVDDSALAATAQALTDAGHIPGLAVGHGVDAIADFLSVLAHATTGYVARVADADGVLALLGATAAALSGFDVREAVVAPDPGRLVRLVPEATDALREILLAVEVDDPGVVARDLAVRGLVTR